MDAYNITFIQKSCNIFNKPPHEWQVDVGAGILWSHNNNSDHNQMLIRKTGEGKSLIILVTGACLGCVTLCISPLLSLAMDQSRKVLKYTPPTSQIALYHLDELSQSQLIELQGKLICQPPSIALFLYTLAQCLWKRLSFRDFLLWHSLINFIIIDEIHLFSQFASTFQQEFGILKTILFDKVLQSAHSVPTLFMTATCTPSLVMDLEALKYRQITHHHWPSSAGMAHRSVVHLSVDDEGFCRIFFQDLFDFGLKQNLL